jgi:hypothetical protein
MSAEQRCTTVDDDDVILEHSLECFYRVSDDRISLVEYSDRN